MKIIVKSLKNYIIDAILLIILGLFMLIKLGSTLITIYRILGIALLVPGALKVIFYFVKKDKKSTDVLIAGIVQLIAGIVVLAKTEFFVAFFPAVAAVLLAYGAIIMLIRAWKLRNGERNIFIMALVLGIVTLILAGFILAHPTFIARVLMQATGVSLIVEGVALLLVLSRAVSE